MSEEEGKDGVDLEEYKELYEDYGAFATDNYDKTNTRDRRKRGVLYYLKWCEGNDADPVDPDTDELHQYLRSFLGKADTTIAARWSSVSMFYEWLAPEVDTLEEEDNPTAGILENYDLNTQTAEYVKVLRRKGKKDVKALEPDRVKKLFNHPGSPPVRNELLIRLAWATAMRSDEISRVKIDNIDFKDRSIYIRSSKLEPDQELYHRYVFYPRDLEHLLRDWINSRRSALSMYADESPYLFLTHQSEQMRPSHISRIIKEAAHRADDEGDYSIQVQEPMIEEDGNGNTRWLVTGHRIRHSAISHWANNTDLKLPEIRKIAGHEQLETTKDYITTPWEQIRENYQMQIG